MRVPKLIEHVARGLREVLRWSLPDIDCVIKVQPVYSEFVLGRVVRFEPDRWDGHELRGYRTRVRRFEELVA